MIITIFLTGAFVAGVAVLWRNLIYDNKGLRDALHTRLPKTIQTALTCGFCFTFWFALLTVLILNPLQGWQLPLRFAIAPAFLFIFQLFSSWMIVGVIAAIIRFSYVALQELVHYQVHVQNKRDH